MTEVISSITIKLANKGVLFFQHHKNFFTLLGRFYFLNFETV